MSPLKRRNFLIGTGIVGLGLPFAHKAQNIFFPKPPMRIIYIGSRFGQFEDNWTPIAQEDQNYGTYKAGNLTKLQHFPAVAKRLIKEYGPKVNIISGLDAITHGAHNHSVGLTSGGHVGRKHTPPVFPYSFDVIADKYWASQNMDHGGTLRLCPDVHPRYDSFSYDKVDGVHYNYPSIWNISGEAAKISKLSLEDLAILKRIIGSQNISKAQARRLSKLVQLEESHNIAQMSINNNMCSTFSFPEANDLDSVYKQHIDFLVNQMTRVSSSSVASGVICIESSFLTKYRT
jgi:hypothetical protein